MFHRENLRSLLVNHLNILKKLYYTWRFADPHEDQSHGTRGWWQDIFLWLSETAYPTYKLFWKYKALDSLRLHHVLLILISCLWLFIYCIYHLPSNDKYEEIVPEMCLLGIHLVPIFLTFNKSSSFIPFFSISKSLIWMYYIQICFTNVEHFVKPYALVPIHENCFWDSSSCTYLRLN